MHQLQSRNQQLQAAAALFGCDIKDQAPLMEAMKTMRTLQTFDSIGSTASTASAASTAASMPNSPNDPDRCRIFVGGLSNAVDELVLAGAFSLFGPVAASKIVRSAKGQQSRGYGFVTFHHSQHAILAVEAVQQLMGLLKVKDGGVLDKLTVDYSTSSHTDYPT